MVVPAHLSFGSSGEIKTSCTDVIPMFPSVRGGCKSLSVRGYTCVFLLQEIKTLLLGLHHRYVRHYCQNRTLLMLSVFNSDHYF